MTVSSIPYIPAHPVSLLTSRRVLRCTLIPADHGATRLTVSATGESQVYPSSELATIALNRLELSLHQAEGPPSIQQQALSTHLELIRAVYHQTVQTWLKDSLPRTLTLRETRFVTEVELAGSRAFHAAFETLYARLGESAR